MSEANVREHWRARSARRRKQQEAVAIFVPRARLAELGKRAPLVIDMMRYSKTQQQLDSDNLAGAFKHVRDELAKGLGIDDGHASLLWRVFQMRGEEIGVGVRICACSEEHFTTGDIWRQIQEGG